MSYVDHRPVDASLKEEPSVTLVSVSARSAADAPPWYSSLTGAQLVAGTPVAATDVCFDSRRVTQNAVFIAIPGLRYDGNAYIPQALAAGASAVIVQSDARARWEPHLSADDVAFVAVPDARVALAQAASGFFDHPARSLGVIGVTGTDGKTTTSHLVAHVLNASGMPSGLLSSVEFVAGGAATLNASHMTTLEAPEVQRQLARIRDANDRYAVVEASSIGLEMHRVDECEFDVGVFTNLTQDHLDYHRTMDAYRDAKAILFRMLGDSADKGIPKFAILNADDPASEAMRAATTVAVRTYALAAAADVTARDITLDGFGTAFTVVADGESVRARSGLLGGYNVANCLAATAVALSQGVPLDTAAAAFESFAGVPGRMERIEAGQPFRVVVDIASTEGSMANVLRVLRPATPGRLVVVFGAAGERDIERRSGIARSVAAGADYAIIANEDPRSEDADAIIDEIARGLTTAGFAEGRAFERIPDRRSALGRAFELARTGDTVLIAGKGTEQSIVIGTTHHPWDERVVARELLGRRDTV